MTLLLCCRVQGFIVKYFVCVCAHNAVSALTSCTLLFFITAEFLLQKLEEKTRLLNELLRNMQGETFFFTAVPFYHIADCSIVVRNVVVISGCKGFYPLTWVDDMATRKHTTSLMDWPETMVYIYHKVIETCCIALITHKLADGLCYEKELQFFGLFILWCIKVQCSYYKKKAVGGFSVIRSWKGWFTIKTEMCEKACEKLCEQHKMMFIRII